MGNGIIGSRLTTVPVSPTTSPEINSILASYGWQGNGTPGTPLEITYSFPEPGTWEGTYSTLQEYTDMQPLYSALRPVVRAALDAWERVANVTFTEVADTADQAGDLRFAMSRNIAEAATGEKGSGHAYFPWPDAAGRNGDIWLNLENDWSNAEPGSFAFWVILHEIGHAMGGLRHPHEAGDALHPKPVMDSQWDNVKYTLMSYEGTDDPALPVTPMFYDTLAIQYIYGENPTATTGNDLYQVAEADFTIWDNGGIDTLDFSALHSVGQASARIDLTPGFSSNAGSIFVQNMNDTVIENAIGTPGDDTLIGNAAANELIGGSGSDELSGSDGLDTAVWGGPSRTYEINLDSDTNHVVADETGTDRASGIETLAFADGDLVTGTAHPAAQVYRLFESAVGREPDADLLNAWTRAIETGALTLRDASNGFASSQEFGERYAQPDSWGFVTLLYTNVLGRAPDEPGLSFWAGELDKGVSRSDALLTFSESAENIDRTSDEIAEGLWLRDEQAAIVARLYDSALGRRPDADGLVDWTAVLKAGASPSQMAETFFATPEAQQHYGALDDPAFAGALYRNVLDREASPGEIDSWSNLLATGLPRSEIVLSFSESAEHRSLVSVEIDDGIWLA